MKFDGYKEATRIDERINLLLERYPIEKNTAHDWMNFCRTIESGLKLLNKLAYEEFGSEKACQEIKLKAETITLRIKKWVGTWPSKCQICPVDLSQQKYFVDGKTKQGSWALMCPLCHTMYGVGLGLGKGQKYDSKTLEKLEG